MLNAPVNNSMDVDHGVDDIGDFYVSYSGTRNQSRASCHSEEVVG